jgi:hypothetical protein
MLAIASVTTPAETNTLANTETIKVEGPLGSISTSPLVLSPAFDLSITDYVLRCASGINTIQVTLGSSARGFLNVRGNRGSSVVVTESLVENEALVISSHGPHDPGGTEYWIRCLPHDFPQLSVATPGTPPSGWYLTGNVNRVGGSGVYAMVLDEHGTPVWYRKPATVGGPLDVTALPDGSIAWMGFAGGFGADPNGAFEDYNLSTQATRWIGAPIPPTDPHELHPMPNGDLMMMSTPLQSGFDLSVFGASSTATVVDCLLQEVNAAGQLVWQWRASDHISGAESVQVTPSHVNGQLAYDAFHCNAIDTDPITGDVLLSLRNADAIYRISKSTGLVIWKIGGNPFNHDGAQILSIQGDPEGAFHAQHDARFQIGNDVSLYDDQSRSASMAARGVEYHIDTSAGTATLVWSYQSPDGHNAAATGSFRRLSGGTDNVIGWGFKLHTLFTEVDANGSVLLNVTFPNGEQAYRVLKVPTSALDRTLLRTTAGLPPFVGTPGG